MFGTPVTDVAKEVRDRIDAIDSEIAYNRKELKRVREELTSRIQGHERQVDMLTKLRAGYCDLINDSALNVAVKVDTSN